MTKAPGGQVYRLTARSPLGLRRNLKDRRTGHFFDDCPTRTEGYELTDGAGVTRLCRACVKRDAEGEMA